MPMVQDILRLFKEFSEGVGLEEGLCRVKKGKRQLGVVVIQCGNFLHLRLKERVLPFSKDRQHSTNVLQLDNFLKHVIFAKRLRRISLRRNDNVS